MKRIAPLLLAFALHAANAQAPVPTTLEVQSLAPQLVAFAGGDANFAALVNGLALGVPVTLSTAIGNGTVQSFTFTPAGTMSATQIAQVLESARQSLIARGIATPNAQQLGAILTGGSLTTALGATPVSPLINTTPTATTGTTVTQSPAAAIQGSMSPAAASAAAGAT